MRRLLFWSIGVSCLWVGGIVVFGALLQAGAGLASEVLGFVYAPALFVAVSLAEDAQHPNALLIIAALLAQTFLMALCIRGVSEWRRRALARKAKHG